MTTAPPARPGIEAPSVVDAIRRLYELSDRRKPSTGYPTGSRLGTCAAQLQMLRFPETSLPERTPVRTVMGFDEGRRVETWFAEVLAQAYPDLVGLRQEPFYFAVDLPEPWMLDDLAGQIQARAGRRLWGTVMAGFRPPSMRVGDDGRVKLRLLSNKRMGFVLDPPRAVVWVPTYLDFALLHPRQGLVVLEVKSLSNFAFRRAVVGTLDYGKRAQLTGIRAATGLPVALVGYRKETHHLAEICYLTGSGQNRVVLTRPNGTQEVFFPEGEGLRPAAGGPATWPAEATWEQVQCEIWTPDDPAMLAAIGARVRRVLFARPGAWHREYGPDFGCRKCGGAGQLACRHCKGTGITAKLGKPCGGECGKAPLPDRPGMVACPDCAGQGALQDAELGYPCSYAIPPETPVLLADYSWRPAGKLQLGDEIVSVTESEPGERRERAITIGRVERVAPRRRTTIRLETPRGPVVSSPEHPWLVRLPSRQGGAHWREAARIKPGQFLCWLGEPRDWVPVELVRVSQVEVDLIDLQTSTKTFIAGGFVSHNCPVLPACYGPAGLRLELDTKPHWWVTRAAYEAAGLSFTPPEPA